MHLIDFLPELGAGGGVSAVVLYLLRERWASKRKNRAHENTLKVSIEKLGEKNNEQHDTTRQSLGEIRDSVTSLDTRFQVYEGKTDGRIRRLEEKQ